MHARADEAIERDAGNLTGVSFLAVELMPKRLELLSEQRPVLLQQARSARVAGIATCRPGDL